MTERIEKLCEASETGVGSLPPLDGNVLLVKRSMEQHGRVPWKRRRIPLHLIPEEGTDVHEMAAFGRGLGIPRPLLGCRLSQVLRCKQPVALRALACIRFTLRDARRTL